MNRSSLLLLAAAVLCVGACEQHPLPGESAAPAHPHQAPPAEQHAGGKAPAPGEARDVGSQPAAQQPGATPAIPATPASATPAPAGDPAKFFPEKK